MSVSSPLRSCSVLFFEKDEMLDQLILGCHGLDSLKDSELMLWMMSFDKSVSSVYSKKRNVSLMNESHKKLQ